MSVKNALGVKHAWLFLLQLFFSGIAGCLCWYCSMYVQKAPQGLSL